ncbi:MAG: lamin tail domain-containing protein, partial [Bacteroidales bacterium]|nr:lamin tail domain-containing protein [Bacteroidales bacterium]
ALLLPALATGHNMVNPVVAQVPAANMPGDVIITEIMADPLPEVSLPGKEYLELKNRSDHIINLKGWTLSTPTQKLTFTQKSLPPGEYIIVCSVSDTSLFKRYGRTAGLKSFTILTNEGKAIALKDNEGNFIHGIEYDISWYGNELKSEGGWSLELIDTDYPFSGRENWKASVSKTGGTPGTLNSVTARNPDHDFEGINNAFAGDSSTIYLSFSESVPDFTAQPGLIKIDSDEIADLYLNDILFKNFCIKPSVILARGKTYVLEISDLSDFAGNRIRKKSFSFGLTEKSVRGDVVFNELLFNPLPGDDDYIEFYNCSDKIIDASRLLAVSVNDATGDTSSFIQVSPVNRCILPGTYYTITTSRDKVIQRYPSSDPEKIFEVSSLPSMSDDKGHLLLLNRELEIIDEVIYDEKMHYPLLTSNEGVALEKSRPDIPSSDRSAWHSASESSGWGTPGAGNSNITELNPNGNAGVNFSSTKISPDNDGFEDLLVIDLNLEGPGNVISATVFDETGSFVRKLAGNLLSGPKLTLVWDGTADDNTIVPAGIYIILITGFNDSGNTYRWKKACSVVRR